jgi:hypothetical protein
MTFTRLAALLLFSSALLRADTLIPPGQQLELDFTLPSIPPGSTNGMVLTSTNGSGSGGTFMISSTLSDGDTPLGPTVERAPSVDRWILDGTSHPNPSFPLTQLAPLLDGTIQGRLVIRNLGTLPQNTLELNGGLQLRTATFSSNGSYTPGVSATLTRIAVVTPGEETPVITAIQKLPGTVQLTWTSTAGRDYRIERSENLSSWSSVLTLEGAAGWTSAGFPEITPPSGRAFFRVVPLP